ncbi:VOC family protein [Dactylosporangium sp. AC04546]|uniref:VOC family protein n=1 Tax=Dactylosporangium sp. AC04546 TaxID=2862460 RepID=UPI001EE032FD|nr:VOC family protein [Dactylosporangium sp. AC04546]WVK88096.1 VOC family protein [Dactylosporangium sp. AC04546]
MTAFNGIGWFEVGTDDPASAERFYGDVFGWTVAGDDSRSTDPAYRFFATGDPDGLRGGLFATDGRVPNYAIFAVRVADVDDTCRRVEAAGGKIQRPAQTNAGGVTFAHVIDPSGNLFGVFAVNRG